MWTGIQVGKLNQSANIVNHTLNFWMNRRRLHYLLIRSEVFETIWKIGFLSQWYTNSVHGNWLGFISASRDEICKLEATTRVININGSDLLWFFGYKWVWRKIISPDTTKQTGCKRVIASNCAVISLLFKYLLEYLLVYIVLVLFKGRNCV